VWGVMSGGGAVQGGRMEASRGARAHEGLFSQKQRRPREGGGYVAGGMGGVK